MDSLVESILLNHSFNDEEKEPTRTPNEHYGPQTGPKGVLADQAFHKQQMNQQKNESIKAYNEKMLSKAITTTSYQEDEKLLNLQNNDEELLKELEDVESNEEEKKILEKYREMRLKEMKIKQFHKLYNNNGNSSNIERKRFGNLKEISSNQYVKAIDEEPSNVSIVVHIFDNSIPQCRLLNDCLANLARKYVKAKFLRILANDLDFDVVGLPTLLVYRNGRLIVNLVKVTDEIGETNFDVDNVEDVLTR
ncbi:18051_t:CDS:2 [Entrophospora sp. SA101]|nr:18051_t:CDS:2 [Entrophospora sp. SA101]